jgi:hypothetical protein
MSLTLPMRKIKSTVFGVITLLLGFTLDASSRTPWKFDMFSHLSCRDELVRVDNYSSQLAKLKDVLAVIVIYAGRNDTMRGEVTAHLFSIRDRLVKNESIGATSIVLLDGGFREEQEIELFIIPSDARDSARYLAVPTLNSGEGRLKKSVFTSDVYFCSKDDESVAPSNKRLGRTRNERLLC